MQPNAFEIPEFEILRLFKQQKSELISFFSLKGLYESSNLFAKRCKIEEFFLEFVGFSQEEKVEIAQLSLPEFQIFSALLWVFPNFEENTLASLRNFLNFPENPAKSCENLVRSVFFEFFRTKSRLYIELKEAKLKKIAKNRENIEDLHKISSELAKLSEIDENFANFTLNSLISLVKGLKLNDFPSLYEVFLCRLLNLQFLQPLAPISLENCMNLLGLLQNLVAIYQEFAKIDKDQNHEISVNEFVRSLQRNEIKVLESEFLKDFAQINADKDDGITFFELCQHVLPENVEEKRLFADHVQEFFVKFQGFHDVFMERFKKLDEDGNGALEKSEFFKGFAEIKDSQGKRVFSDFELAKLFKAIDGNGDGTVSFEEFEEGCRRLGIFQGNWRKREEEAMEIEEEKKEEDVQGNAEGNQRQNSFNSNENRASFNNNENFQGNPNNNNNENFQGNPNNNSNENFQGNPNNNNENFQGNPNNNNENQPNSNENQENSHENQANSNENQRNSNENQGNSSNNSNENQQNPNNTNNESQRNSRITTKNERRLNEDFPYNEENKEEIPRVPRYFPKNPAFFSEKEREFSSNLANFRETLASLSEVGPSDGLLAFSQREGADFFSTIHEILVKDGEAGENPENIEFLLRSLKAFFLVVRDESQHFSSKFVKINEILNDLLEKFKENTVNSRVSQLKSYYDRLLAIKDGFLEKFYKEMEAQTRENLRIRESFEREKAKNQGFLLEISKKDAEIRETQAKMMEILRENEDFSRNFKEVCLINERIDSENKALKEKLHEIMRDFSANDEFLREKIANLQKENKRLVREDLQTREISKQTAQKQRNLESFQENLEKKYANLQETEQNSWETVKNFVNYEKNLLLRIKEEYKQDLEVKAFYERRLLENEQISKQMREFSEEKERILGVLREFQEKVRDLERENQMKQLKLAEFEEKAGDFEEIERIRQENEKYQEILKEKDAEIVDLKLKKSSWIGNLLGFYGTSTPNK